MDDRFGIGLTSLRVISETVATRTYGELKLSGLMSDQYVNIEAGCPISTEVDRGSESVIVVLGPRLGRSTTLRLTVKDVDTCHRLASAFTDMRNGLVEMMDEQLTVHEDDSAPAERGPSRRLFEEKDMLASAIYEGEPEVVSQ